MRKLGEFLWKYSGLKYLTHGSVLTVVGMQPPRSAMRDDTDAYVWRAMLLLFGLGFLCMGIISLGLWYLAELVVSWIVS